MLYFHNSLTLIRALISYAPHQCNREVIDWILGIATRKGVSSIVLQYQLSVAVAAVLTNTEVVLQQWTSWSLLITTRKIIKSFFVTTISKTYQLAQNKWHYEEGLMWQSPIETNKFHHLKFESSHLKFAPSVLTCKISTEIFKIFSHSKENKQFLVFSVNQYYIKKLLLILHEQKRLGRLIVALISIKLFLKPLFSLWHEFIALSHHAVSQIALSIVVWSQCYW